MSIDVPFLPERSIADEAALLLACFERDQKWTPTVPVPIDDIVEIQLKLTFEIKDLQSVFGLGDVHGAIWFREGKIAVDQRLDPHRFPTKRGRYRFTLAHETGHWCLHRKWFLKTVQTQTLFDDGTPRPDHVCRSTQKKLPVEWQADFFAAQLLMPRNLVVEEWDRWHGSSDPICLSDLGESEQRRLLDAEVRRRGRDKDGRDAENDLVLDHLVIPVAERFEVSPEAMRIRLERLGYLTRKKVATLFA